MGTFIRDGVIYGGGSEVSVTESGTASSTVTHKQEILVDSVSYTVTGSMYMEQDFNLVTSQETTVTFTNTAITDDSVIDVFAGRYGGDEEGEQNVFPYIDAFTDGENNEFSVTYPKVTEQTHIVVRIYIR